MEYVWIAGLAGAAWIVADAVRVYRKTPGTELLTAFHNSATIALARVTQFLSAALLALSDAAGNLAGLVSDPSTADAIKGVVAQYKPEATAAAVLAIALAGAFEASRRRTLSSGEDK